MIDKQSVASERSLALATSGLLLIGPAPNRISYNREALEILTYPTPPTSARRITSVLVEKAAALFDKHTDGQGFAATEFRSGRRSYCCSRYILNPSGQKEARAVVTLLERPAMPINPVRELHVGFNLTERERQAVGFLIQGLTSKEIAQRMNISPNTVKAFLRLVMTKAGVSTRTGLVGQIAGLVPRRPVMSEGPSQNSNLFPRSALRFG
jgi:DNA-binding CsgD family transcriptional regulator